jgi:hypothetical protein
MTAPTNVLPFGKELEKHWLVQESFGNVRSMISLELSKQASLGLTDDEAHALMPSTADFCNRIERSPDFSYHIIIPIGVGEIWGHNFRSDLVFRQEMIPDINSPEFQRRPYGFPTFSTAHFFAHHRNKPHLGHPVLGDVQFVTLNDKMQWVETVVRINLPSVEQHEPQLLTGILHGQFPVSMGLLALADVCTYCGNVRNTPTSKACIHITHPKDGGELGRIYPDGRVAGMANIKPRFFDISDVIRGADSIGYSLKKVAEDASAAAVAAATVKQDRIVIREALKALKQRGVLQLVKPVPAGGGEELEKLSLVKKAAKTLADEEPDIDHNVLTKQANLHGAENLLSAMAMQGVLLRPHEFQAVHLADDPMRLGVLESTRRTFPVLPTDSPDFARALGQPFRISPNGTKVWVGQNLAPWKSWNPEALMQRIAGPPAVVAPMLPRQPWAATGADLSDVKIAYMKYLAQALAAITALAERFASPEVFSMSGDADVADLAKEASLGPLAAVLPVMYFAKLMGQDLNAARIPDIVASEDAYGNKFERSFLQKLIMFNPFIGTSLLGAASKGSGKIIDRLDDILLRRLVR